MKNFLILLSCVSALVFISACSTISKEECQVGDWSGLGERDGSKGQKMDRFYKYVEECNEHGYQPDINAYKSGYQEGLKSYCTPDNGYRLGKSGSSYAGICPASLSRAFEASYRKGKDVYSMNTKIRRVQNEIDSIDSQIQREQKVMVSGAKTGPEVAVMAMQHDKLRQKQRDLQRQKNALQLKLQALEGAAVSVD